MDWVIWIAVLFMVGATINNVRINNQIKRSITGGTAVPVKELEAPDKLGEHRLVRTWIVSTKDGRIDAGWRWKCACGVWGLASGAYSRSKGNGLTEYELGTEKQAIAGFKEHALNYKEVNTDFYKEKFEKVEAEFAQYRKLCYCKETNHDLLKWKGI